MHLCLSYMTANQRHTFYGFPLVHKIIIRQWTDLNQTKKSIFHSYFSIHWIIAMKVIAQPFAQSIAITEVQNKRNSLSLISVSRNNLCYRRTVQGIWRASESDRELNRQMQSNENQIQQKAKEKNNLCASFVEWDAWSTISAVKKHVNKNATDHKTTLYQHVCVIENYENDFRLNITVCLTASNTV